MESLFKTIVVILLIVDLSKCEDKWIIIPTGTTGGLDESDLSAYLLSSPTSKTFVALDAGTLYSGLRKTNEYGFLASFAPEFTYEERPVNFLQKYVRAYLLSHAHLDHIAGLIIDSAEDTGQKTIVGTNTTMTYFSDNIFNGKIWANFGPTGIGNYMYAILDTNSEVFYNIPDTNFVVKAFLLNHGYPYKSTAFLLREIATNNYILYFGDVGPDEVENKVIPSNMTEYKNLTRKVWEAVAPLIVQKFLTTIFLECSYTSDRPDNLLFGHLTPKWMKVELEVLNGLVIAAGGEKGIAGLNIIVTHIKPVPSGADIRSQIKQELTSNNNLNVNFVVPTQGFPMHVTSDGIYPQGSSGPDSSTVSSVVIVLLVMGGVLIAIMIVMLALAFLYRWTLRNRGRIAATTTRNYNST